MYNYDRGRRFLGDLKKRSFKGAEALTISEAGADSGRPDTIMIYDGDCGLCHRAVGHVLKWDRREEFRFAGNRSDVGRGLLKEAGMRLDPPPETMVVLIEGKCFTKSDAALVIAGRLGGVHSVLRLGWLVPRFMRDWCYDRIARNRHAFFGSHDRCELPVGAERSRFLDQG